MAPFQTSNQQISSLTTLTSLDVSRTSQPIQDLTRFHINNDDRDDVEKNNENINQERKKRGCSKLEYIHDSRERANRKYKRKEGLLTKLKEFDVMTGSSSILISVGEDEDKSAVTDSHKFFTFKFICYNVIIANMLR